MPTGNLIQIQKQASQKILILTLTATLNQQKNVASKENFRVI
jgi:hypothetical protein